MPSKKTKKSSSDAPSSSAASQTHVFYPLVALMFVIWMLYRFLFSFDIWFDEIIGKAIFFGLPVMLYISATKADHITETWAPEKLKPGLLLGLGVGGMFAFTAAIVGIVMRGDAIETAPLFNAGYFWWEMFLSIMTGFWESLFFFAWMGNELMRKEKNWPLVWQLIGIATLFLAFHVPNLFNQFPGSAVVPAMLLLWLFAVGQGLLFLRWRNLYALTLTHALWGMALLFHL
jgi:hypothetical protein